MRAIDSKGELLEFFLSADDPTIVSEELKRRKAKLLSLRHQLEIRRLFRWPGSDSKQIDLMVRELSSLLRAGLTLSESVSLLAEKETSESHRHLLQRLLTRLQEGDRLSVAFSKEAERFPPLLVAMTRAGEDVAGLVAGFERYLRYAQLSQTLKRKVAVAMVYPSILIAVAIVVTLFLALVVVPRFAGVFADSARELPVATAALLSVSRFLSNHAIALAALILLAGSAIMLAWRSGRVRVPPEWLESVPVLGERLRTARVARLLMAMSALLEAGVPLSRALVLSKRVLPSSWARRLDSARQAVEEGNPLSDSLSKVQASTLVADRLLRVGERSGNLAGMASQAARHHEEELERFLDRLMRMLEPLLMAFIGLVIGGIVIALYLPLFDLAQWIQ